MGKDRSEKKDKKEKKEKRSESDGVKKASKKEKKSKLSGDNVAAIAEALETADSPVVESTTITVTEGETVAKPVGALVPFAAPLADEKVAKKVLKSVKKGKKFQSSICLRPFEHIAKSFH